MVLGCGAALRLGCTASQCADTHRIAVGFGTLRASSIRNRRAGTSSKGKVGAPCETNRTGMRSDMMILGPTNDGAQHMGSLNAAPWGGRAWQTWLLRGAARCCA